MTVTDRSICRVVYSRRQQTTHWSRCIGREMSTLTDSVIPSPEYRTRDIEKRRGDGIVVDGWMDWSADDQLMTDKRQSTGLPALGESTYSFVASSRVCWDWE